jgi:ferredoxin
MDEPTPASVGVDREKCLTAAICLAYNIYELDDEAKAVLLTRNDSNSDDPGNALQQDGYVAVEDLVNEASVPLEEMRRLVLESAKACPFNAIIVKDADGKVIWPQEV